MLDENDEFVRHAYKYGDTLVVRQKDGKCWQLTIGDYMEELKGAHKDILEAKKSNDIKDTLWKLTIAMEYLVTAMMEKERMKDD